MPQKHESLEGMESYALEFEGVPVEGGSWACLQSCEKPMFPPPQIGDVVTFTVRARCAEVDHKGRDEAKIKRRNVFLPVEVTFER